MNKPFSTNITGSDAASWFTVEKADTDTFVISEKQHWEETNCYLLLGSEQALLIDTGLGVANIQKVVAELTDLPVLATTTHVHWDHIGGHGFFQNIAVHEAEESWLSGQFPLPLSAVTHSLASKCCVFPKEFHLEDYKIFQGHPTRILHNGDCIDLGGRKLTVLHTPGHSPGHCCFYEAERSSLYSGDLIYIGCLDAFYPSTEPQQFYRSIKKIASLNVKRIYPGHHTLNISPDIIVQIQNAFQELDHSGKLHHGTGVFHFGKFQIHL